MLAPVIDRLPVLVLMPHSRCNCRCVMCDIWRANNGASELSLRELANHLPGLLPLGVRRVVLSGGEALLHRELWSLCELIRDRGIQITLLSSGLLLERSAAEIVQWCEALVVSLDGSPEVHDQVRGVRGAFRRLARGVEALRALRPDLPISGRCVVQRANFHDLERVVITARDLGLNQISFLAADVSTTAFAREESWSEAQVNRIALDEAETRSLELMIEWLIERYAAEIAGRFIAESPAKLRRLPQYYSALRGSGPFPEPKCNAPWVSAVVEANGDVRPCFFHPPYGNLSERPLVELLNGDRAQAFRNQLRVSEDPVCRRCVCSLHLQPGEVP